MLMLWMMIIYAATLPAQVTDIDHAATSFQPAVLSGYQADAFSCNSDPASMVLIKQAQAGISMERKFMLNALYSYAGVAILPAASGHFGFRWSYGGLDAFRQSGAALAYARALGKTIQAGVQFRYSSISVKGYGGAQTIGYVVAANACIGTQMRVGLLIGNFGTGKFNRFPGEKLPVIVSAGFAHDFSGNFVMAMNICKEEDSTPRLSAGFQYRLAETVLVKCAFSTSGSQASFGAGIRMDWFRVDVSTAYHPQLGISPGIGVLFFLKQDREGHVQKNATDTD